MPSAASTKQDCPNCNGSRLEPFFYAKDVPVNSCLMVSSKQQALEFPLGELQLAFCKVCGFITNTLFDPSGLEYSASYEETQGFSPRFNEFSLSLVQDLVGRYDIRSKRILEIGCGKGEFLGQLCEVGDNRGVGIDPAYVPGRLSPAGMARTEFITDYFGEKYASLTADVVCCRHTLEHIPNTRDFLMTVRNSIGTRTDTLVFFEVPDTERVLREAAFWDIYYEHCSYFDSGALRHLFEDCGFRVARNYKGFDDQYLLIEAFPSNERGALPYDTSSISRDVESFRETCPQNIAKMGSELRTLVDAGKRVVLWGSGSKAVAYLTLLGVREEIEYVVDINPFKQGKFLAGTGHQIVAPEFLQEYLPDTVILMNSIYKEEVQASLNELSVAASLVAL